MKEEIVKCFEEKFGNDPFVFSSPGRVNLIGEHTDYNDGFVLPAAVDKAIYFAVKPNLKNEYNFYSYDLLESFQTKADQIAISDTHWANYLLGVLAQFSYDGKAIPGFDCVFGGDVPVGAGMSSSAAIECGLAFAVNTLFELNYSIKELALLSQKAEHEYAGVKCGIMDQFAVMHGKANQVIKLDCRSLDYTYYSMDMLDYMLVLVNTGVKHSLASSEYNKRRQECEAGVELLKKYDPDISALRDVSIALIQSHQKELDPVVYKRCLYVINENIRLEKACKALETGDFTTFGFQMYGSHEGLRDNYEVSCPELDHLVEIAKDIDGVLGARMMGGGFGGCTINLVKRTRIEAFEKAIIENYETPEGETPEIIKVQIGDGTREI